MSHLWRSREGLEGTDLQRDVFQHLGVSVSLTHTHLSWILGPFNHTSQSPTGRRVASWRQAQQEVIMNVLFYR